MTQPNNDFYDNIFFGWQSQGALQSARIIVPVLLSVINPSSVIDIGCGLGAWLKVFNESGIKKIRGIDGPHIDKSKLLIDAEYFFVMDLSKITLLQIGEQYDLTVCLEVVEHLSHKIAPKLIDQLTAMSPLVLFSAAIPEQKGTGHVNERSPFYWKSLFAKHGYRRLDPIRRHIWQNNQVEWWYRQNIFLFASSKVIAESSLLQREEKISEDMEFELIQRKVFQRYMRIYDRMHTLGGVITQLPIVIWRLLKQMLY